MTDLQKMIPLSSRENWDHINDELKHKAFATHAGSIKVFSSVAQALIELAQGTSQFLSHKKNVSVFYGANPSFELLVPNFIRDGLQVLSLKVTDLPKSLEDAKKWVDSIPKETAYVLFPEDHVVSAEIYHWDFIDQALNDKRIIAIRLSHHQHFQNQSPARPFSVRICIFDASHIVAVCGARFKTPAGSVVWMNWPKEYAQTFEPLLHRTLNEVTIKQFETELSEFTFLKTESRVFDRSVLVFPGVNADRLIHALPHLQASSPNLCSWNSYRMNQGWWWPEPSEKTMQSMLIIPASALVDSEASTQAVAKEVRATYAKMLKEQTWTVK